MVSTLRYHSVRSCSKTCKPLTLLLAGMLYHRRLGHAFITQNFPSHPYSQACHQSYPPYIRLPTNSRIYQATRRPKHPTQLNKSSQSSPFTSTPLHPFLPTHPAPYSATQTCAPGPYHSSHVPGSYASRTASAPDYKLVQHVVASAAALPI